MLDGTSPTLPADVPDAAARGPPVDFGRTFPHMKQSTRIASLAATAALGAGVAMAVGATPAHATDLSVWDRVAQCESSGNWAINTGNGFYGGLQFTRSTWLGYGGGAYASTANLASKSQQIAIAQKVLASQGPGAWPVCSVRAGLTTSNGGTSVAVRANVTPKRTVTHERTVTREVDATTRSATRKSFTTPKASEVAGTKYSVRAGDTLSTIAERNHVAGGWQGLWQKNRATISNPNLIFVDQVITL